MKEYYSKQAICAFLVLVGVYILMVGILCCLRSKGAITGSTELGKDVMPWIASLPFVAFYLVVLLAATAGYARGAIVAETLPFNQVLKAELQAKKMDRASIKTTIRSGGQINKGTSFVTALTNLASSRLPILAVVDPKTRKVSGVITSHDIIRKLQEEIARADRATLGERLEKLTVESLEPREPVVATTDENLAHVLGTMIREQFTKLIVVESREGKEFAGTIDVLDLVGEIAEDAPGK